MLTKWCSHFITARLRGAGIELLADVFVSDAKKVVVATLHDEAGVDLFEELTPDQLDALADGFKELALTMRGGEIEVSLGVEKGQL